MSPDALAEPEDDAGVAEELRKLPRGWAWSRLGEVLPLEYGKALPDRLRDRFGKAAVYGSSGLVGRHSIAITIGPTIIVGRKGSAGAVFYCDEDCWPIDTVYFAKPNPAICLRYGFYFLKWKRLGRLDQSTAIPSLSRDIYSVVAIPLAPLPEQRRLVAQIDDLFAEIAEGEAALERARQGLDTWRRALLKAAVTGELTRDWRQANRPAETGGDLLARISAELQTSPAISRRTRGSNSSEQLDIKPLPQLPEGWAWASLHEIIESLRNGIATVPVKRETKCPILRILQFDRWQSMPRTSGTLTKTRHADWRSSGPARATCFSHATTDRGI
jgi:type I restriction enzyme S subunit